MTDKQTTLQKQFKAGISSLNLTWLSIQTKGCFKIP